MEVICVLSKEPSKASKFQVKPPKMEVICVICVLGAKPPKMEVICVLNLAGKLNLDISTKSFQKSFFTNIFIH